MSLALAADLDRIEIRLRQRGRILPCLDFIGMLAAIVCDPEQAVMGDEMRELARPISRSKRAKVSIGGGRKLAREFGGDFSPSDSIHS